MPATHPAYLALLAAVCAAPDDDAPRLVLADWLDEHGGPELAAFIRVQVGDPTLSARTWGYRSGDWNAPADSVLPARALRSIPGIPRGWDDGTELVFCRGLLGSLTCAAADWLAHGDALLWSPEQTELCEICDTLARVERMLGQQPEPADPDCALCKGTGRVPRPCPPTAQPITEVRLATFPLLRAGRPTPGRYGFADDSSDWSCSAEDCDLTGNGRENMTAVCRLRWPSVKSWRLPADT